MRALLSVSDKAALVTFARALNVRRYELASGKVEDVEKADWDVSSTFFSKNESR